MSFERIFAGARLLLVLMLVLVVGIAGCGGSDDPDSGGDPNEATAAEDTGPRSQKDRVADVMRDLREAYNESDGPRFCSSLTARGKRDVESIVPKVKLKARDCPGIVEEFSRAVVSNGTPQRVVEILSVTIKGSRARVVMKGGLSGIRSVLPFRLFRIKGEWKLDDPIAARKRMIRVDRDGPPEK